MHRTYRAESDIDRDASQIAQASLSTHPDPTHEAHLSALWELANLVPTSRVYYQVTARLAHGASAQERADLEVELSTLAIDKIIQRRKDGSWYLDLARFADDASFSAWLRANAEKALASIRRNVRLRMREQHPTGEITEGASTTLTLSDETACDQAISLFKAATVRSDAASTSYAAAAALSTGLGLRLPSRAALNPPSRQRLADLLGQDTALAHRTAIKLLHGDVADLDEDLVALIDTVPDAQIQEWVDCGPQVSHVMLAAVLDPTPPVKNATARAMKSAVRSAHADTRSGQVTSRLIEAWAAWRATITGGSKYCGGFAGLALKTEDEHDADTQRFYEALVAVRRHPAAPYLGSTMREVADWLEEAHTQVEHALANGLDVELTLPARTIRRSIPAARAHLVAV